MSNYSHTPSFVKPPRRRLRRFWRAVFALALGVTAAWAIGKVGGQTFTVIRKGLGSTVITIGGNEDTGTPKLPKIADDPEYEMPKNDKDRLDVLVLGVRGEGDSVNGGLLTDSIMLLSVDTRTGRAALVSIPRDLTVRVTDTKNEKINAAYVYNGLGGTKKLYSRILGVAVDNVVVVDFSAFQAVVDALGGVTITLDQPFEESQQWAGTASESYAFSLPAGPNTLTGEQALYYVRSRYSSSDFDRARRQQQIMVAIKNKAQALDLSSNPVQAVQLMTTIKKHIETDLDIFDLGTIKELMEQGGQLEKIRRYQLTTENLLYETKVNGIYELLPRDNTFAHIKEFFGTVVSEAPVLPTPDPASISPHATTLYGTPSPSPTP